MNLLERIQADYREYNISHTLLIPDVNLLGYLLTDSYLPIGSTPVIFRLYELLDDNKKKQAGISYLFHIKSDSGYLLPRSFSEYLEYLKPPVASK